MSGVKGRSGRRRESKNRADAMRSLTNKLPIAINVITDTMEGTNRDRMKYEAALEIKDSVIGKPKQHIDTEITGGELIGAGTLLQLAKFVQERRRGEDDVQRQGITEGSSQEGSTEA